MITQLLGIILISILVPLLLMLLSKLFPTKGGTTYTYRYNPRFYRKWKCIFFILYIIFIGLLTFIFYKVILSFVILYFNSLGSDIYLARYENLFWSIPALLLGLLFCELPVNIIKKLLLQDYYYDYITYSNLSSPYNVDGAKALIVISFIVIPLCIFATIACANNHTRFTTDKMYIGTYLSMKDIVKNYSDIEYIYKFNKPKETDETTAQSPYYIIKFKHDGEWNSNRYEISIKDFEKKVIEYVIHKYNKKIIVKNETYE